MMPPGRELSSAVASTAKPASCMIAIADRTSRSVTSGTASIGPPSVSFAYAATPPATRSSGAARITTQWRSFQVRARLGAGAGGKPGAAATVAALRAPRLGFAGFIGLSGFGALATFG